MQYTYRLNKAKRDGSLNKCGKIYVKDANVIFYQNESLFTAYHESKQADFSRNKLKEFTSVGSPVR